MRKFAVGKLLGVGHIALFISAIQAFLGHPHWGVSLLDWVYRASVHSGVSVTFATEDSWQANRIISDSYTWVSHLPWGLADGTYFVLALACLIMRLARSMPGWLSLTVALPAAVYGLIEGITRLPLMGLLWPLTAVTLAVAWVVVGKTVRRY